MSEIEYALDTLKADGFGLLTSYGNAWLGDASFAPVLDELNRRKAVVYVHPTDAACCQGLLPRVPNQMLEYPMDTMRTIASLVVSETATRCPDVRFIFSHAGGPLIGVAGRLLGAEMSAENLAKTAEPNSRAASSAALLLRHGRLRRIPSTCKALKTLVGVSQIVFGTDAPFFDGAPQVRGLQTAGFSAAELAARRAHATRSRCCPVLLNPPRQGIRQWRSIRKRSSNSSIAFWNASSRESCATRTTR